MRYHEPHIGTAAVVLEALGFEVTLLKNRRCCGRPAFSQEISTKRNASRSQMACSAIATPMCRCLFLDPRAPQCHRRLSRAEPARFRVRRGTLFSLRAVRRKHFDHEPDALQFTDGATHNVAIHAHCHAKSLLKPGFMATLASRLPRPQRHSARDPGCCGMAGAFGALESKYQLSKQVGVPLVEKIAEQPVAPRLSPPAPLSPSDRTSDSRTPEAYGGASRDALVVNVRPQR